MAGPAGDAGNGETGRHGEDDSMSWDEWEQLKADAAARGSTSMRLNQAAPDGGRRWR
ncbi:hypothetical protein EASAB2608_04393 [Streptomyces sp. EAS-AB2608]|nr:hypothetical protein EASAB2608_04393 [Streptomyces sp. EAS-AB2608]